jgi:glycolate oxidase FAD binding subunit
MSSPAFSPIARLEGLLGAGQVCTNPAELVAYAVDGSVPAAAVQPKDAAEVAEVVKFAAAEGLALIPLAARTKLGMGMPPRRYDVAVDLRRLNRVAHYDPGDLTLSVDAGMPLSLLMTTLAEHKQMLPLAVPYTMQATVGGTVSSGVDSPLRQAYGMPRDYILGMEFVSATGALTKSGGRVVKNVTGYDLHKLFCGALGSLGIITRVNFKTFPLPPASRGFVAAFSDLEGALRLRDAIVSSPLTPVTLDVLSPQMAALFATRAPSTIEPALAPPGDWFHPPSWQLLAAFGGEPAVLARYERDLTRMAREAGASDTVALDDSTRPLVWGRLREAIPLLRESSLAATIFRISLLPSELREAIPLFLEAARTAGLPAALVARAGGTVYLAFLPQALTNESLQALVLASQAVFGLAARLGSQAMVPWCPLELKRQVNIWGQPRPDLPLMQRVKQVFDPERMFAPGRFAGGL